MFYKSKLTIEVEVTHQFEPKSVFNIVKNNLSFPCFENIKLLKQESNFQLHKPPLEKMIDIKIIPKQ